jgi:YVTN family beta-propeller protein
LEFVLYNEGGARSRKERNAMKRSHQGQRILLLVIVGLAMAALAILYLTAPAPTVVTIRVINAETGAPLPGAQVLLDSRGGQALPAVLTDEAGVARFDDVPPGPAHSIQVQKVDFDLGSIAEAAFVEGQETEIVVQLTPHAGERLFVGLDKARVLEIDVASWLPVQTLVLPGASEAVVYHLRLHPTQPLLYAVAGDKGFILDSRSGATLAQMQVETGIDSLDLSADGRYLLVTTVEGGVDDSGTLGLIHLLALGAQSGEIITDSLLSATQGWSTGVILPGDVRVSAEAGDEAAAGSMPQVLWRPEGSHVYVLQAADATVRGMSPLVQAMMMGAYSMPVGPLRLQGSVVLSHDKQYAYTWHAGYLANGDKQVDFVTMIRTDDSTMISGEYPPGTSALAASPVKGELYILNSLLGTLTIRDLSGQGAQTLVAVGKQPELIAISGDGQRAYVGNRASQTISVIDLTAAEVVHTIDLPGEPNSLAIR